MKKIETIHADIPNWVDEGLQPHLDYKMYNALRSMVANLLKQIFYEWNPKYAVVVV